MRDNMGRKYRRRVGYKGLSCFLVINFICLILAGCGAGNGEGQDSAAGDPADSPNGRQVVTAVVAGHSSYLLEQASAWNKVNDSYFIEIKEYGEEGSVMEADEFATQLTLDILSGEGPDLVIWDRFSSWSPALASEKLMENLYDFMEADPDFHK